MALIKPGTIKKSIIFTICSTFPVLSGFVLLPFYTRYLSSELYGMFALYGSIALFLQIIITFAYDTTVASQYHLLKSDFGKLSSYIWSSWVVCVGIFLIMMALVSAAYFIVPDHSISLGNGTFELSLIYLSLSAACISALLKIYSNYLVVSDKPNQFLGLNSMNLLLVLGFSIVLILYFNNNLQAALWGRLAGLMVCLAMCYLLFIKNEFPFTLNFTHIRHTLWVNVPMVFFSMIQWAASYADRFILLLYLSATQIGVYDLAIKLTVVIELLTTGMYNTFYPKIYAQWADTKIASSTQEMNKIYHSLSAVCILIIAGTLWVVPTLVPLISGKEIYNESAKYMPYICLTYVYDILIVTLVNPFIFMNKTQTMPFISGASTGIKLCVASICIYFFGIPGAIAALFIRRAADVALYQYFGGKIYTFSYNPLKMYVVPTLFCIAALLAEYYLTMIPPLWRHSLIFAMAMLLVGGVYYVEIKKLISDYLQKYI
ncbi:MAG: lipopolysaccharide biosynthesis protein [Cytophagales bacterium]|nr:lipopolysaccharide biosynthesis protein [Cytophagales bacterium]